MRVAYVSHIRWESNPRSSGLVNELTFFFNWNLWKKLLQKKKGSIYIFFFDWFLIERKTCKNSFSFDLHFENFKSKRRIFFPEFSFGFFYSKEKENIFGILLLIKEMLLKNIFWILNFLFNFERRIKIFSDFLFYYFLKKKLF